MFVLSDTFKLNSFAHRALAFAAHLPELFNQ